MNQLTESIIQECRAQFPALSQVIEDQVPVYFDGPAGTQVPQRVIDAMSDYLIRCNANHAGLFATSVASDRLLHQVHQAFADFVGCDDPDEVFFGQNSTSLIFALSRAISQSWEKGDEIIVTRLDHDANVTPWVLAARDRGATVKYVEMNHDDCTLDLEDFHHKLSHRTKLVALGCASNSSGSINPVTELAKAAHEVGALVFLDAVHFGPHQLIDVKAFDCDFLACSAYKFFGPHQGIMWGRRELLESVSPYKLRPAPDDLPGSWMTGTQSHESMAGSMAAVDYIADLGRTVSGNPSLNRRQALEAAFESIGDYERGLARRMLDGLQAIDGVKIWGISEESRLRQRFPTISITHNRVGTTDLTQKLAERGIFVWNGNYYALQLTETLGLEPEGMVRIGMTHYNTKAEVDRCLVAIKEICG